MAECSEHTLRSWSHISVGVADLEEALSLWCGQFGFQAVAGSETCNAELERLWSLKPNMIARSALVSSAETDQGQLLLVQFEDPLLSVRHNAELFDSLPKNIDLYTDDVEKQTRRLRAAGYKFKSEEPQEFVADGVTIREIHVSVHDDINVVLIERVGLKLPFSKTGYYGIGMIVLTVPDIEIEQSFFQRLFDLEVEADVTLEGPELEAVTGLPKGTKWLIRIFGQKGRYNGQLELVEYRGVDSKNLYAQSQQGRLGLFEVCYQVGELGSTLSLCEADEIGHSVIEMTDLFGTHCRISKIVSPAGMPIQVMQVFDR